MIDMAILPTEITSAVMTLFMSIAPNGLAALPVPTFHTVAMFASRWVLGTSESGTEKTSFSFIVAEQNATYTGKATTATPSNSMAWQNRLKYLRFSTIGY